MDISKRERPVFRLLPLVFSCAFAIVFSGCRADRTKGQALTFESTSGYSVGATIFAPEKTPAPGIILLHMAGSSRAAWASFQQIARTDGYITIAIDLRGHGETKSADTAAKNPSAFTAEEWLGILDDIATAKRTLIDFGADPNAIAVVGASIGANLALRYAAIDPKVHAVVMLSPSEDYRGVGILKTMETYTRRPVLMIASRGDAYSVASLQKLDKLAKEFCEVRLYPGAAHGTDLFSDQPVTSDQVLMWLDQIFNRKPPDPK